MLFGPFHFKRKAEKILEQNLNKAIESSHIILYIYLLLQYEMIEQDEDGDYDTGDQGNAPNLKEKDDFKVELQDVFQGDCRHDDIDIGKDWMFLKRLWT